MVAVEELTFIWVTGNSGSQVPNVATRPVPVRTLTCDPCHCLVKTIVQEGIGKEPRGS